MSSNTTLLNNAKREAVATDGKDVNTSPDKMNLKHKKYCYFRTATVCLTIMMMGIAFSIKHTSVPDLRILFQCTAEDVSLALAIGTLGGVVGGPLGIFVDKFGFASDLVLATAMLIAGVTFITMPFSPYLWLFGCLEAACNMCLIWCQAASHGIISQIWGPKGESARYAIHFGYPVGSMLGPLIAMPFMSDNTTHGPQTKTDVFSTPVSMNGTNWTEPSRTNTVLNYTDSEPRSDIFKAYAISSGIMLIVMTIFVLMYFCGPRKAFLYRNACKTHLKWKEVLSPRTWGEGNSRFGLLIFLLMFCYYLASLASEKGSLIYLTTYAVDCNLNFNSKEAATLNSLFYGIGIVGRTLAIIAVKYIHITHLIVLETHGLLLFGILCLFVGAKYKLAMWILVPCLGFFLIPIWPAGYVWTNNYVILFGVLVGINDAVLAVPNFFLTRLQGYLYTNIGIESIFYTTIGFGALHCILVHVMNFVGRRHGDRKNRTRQNTVKEGKTTSL